MRRTRLVIALACSAVVLAVLLVGVFPTRALLAQRGDIAAAEERLAVIEAENARLEARTEALATPEEIERLAREEYGLVYPGEEAYGILPPPPPQLPVPDAWPFRGLHEALRE